MNRQLAIEMLRESLKGPSHLRYCLKNIHPIRDHFPEWYSRSRRLKLGGAANVSRIHVILRTTDGVLNLNASRKLEDAGIRSKSDVIRVGGCSLFRAAKAFAEQCGRERLVITLVADRLSDVGLAQYQSAAREAGVDFEIVPAKGRGNGPTFQTQIDLALADADDMLEFILEDDYLLDPQTLVFADRLFRNHANVAGFSPHFHPDRVRRQDVGLLTVIDRRLLARITNTCCTFFIRNSALRAHLRSLRLYTRWEDGSINDVWARELCLAPLGWTLAEHLHLSDLSPVQNLVANDGWA